MKLKYKILGLDCPNCAAKLSAQMAEKEGITSAKINFLTERLTVETDLDEGTAEKILVAAARAFDKGIKIEK